MNQLKVQWRFYLIINEGCKGSQYVLYEENVNRNAGLASLVNFLKLKDIRILDGTGCVKALVIEEQDN